MKNIFMKTMLMTFVMTFIIAFSAQPLMAQSDSYVDTIYQAMGAAAGVSSGSETGDPMTVDLGNIEGADVVVSNDMPSSEANAPEEKKDEPADDKSGDDKSDEDKAKEDESLKHVNLVLADMTRILVGMNMGVPINLDSFTVIDLTGSSSDKPADDKKDDDKKDDDKPADDKKDDDKKDDDKPADDNKDDDKKDDDKPADDNKDDDKKDDDKPADDNKDDDKKDDDKPADDNKDDDKKDDDKPADDKKDDDKPANDDPSLNPDKEDQPAAEETADDLISKIKSNYNIKCSDGDSSFTVRQLQLTEAVLKKLPPSFRKNTTEIIRDKIVPDNAQIASNVEPDQVAGYVIKDDNKVHMLDKATRYTDEDIAEMEKTNERSFSEDELKTSLEYDYSRYLIHEMTHCYQNGDGKALTEEWTKKFWPDGKKPEGSPIGEYSKTLPIEDMAEAVSFYVMGGYFAEKDGKQVFYAANTDLYMDKERYDFIKNKIMGGREYRNDNHPSGGISI